MMRMVALLDSSVCDQPDAGGYPSVSPVTDDRFAGDDRRRQRRGRARRAPSPACLSRTTTGATSAGAALNARGLADCRRDARVCTVSGITTALANERATVDTQRSTARERTPGLLRVN